MFVRRSIWFIARWAAFLGLTPLSLWLKVTFAPPKSSKEHSNVGAQAYDTGDYARAEKHWMAALKEMEGLEKWDEHQATILHNLAKVYFDQDKFAEAESFSERSLAIDEKVLGQDDPRLANSFGNYAMVLWKVGRNTKAEPQFKRSLEILEDIYGPDHPELFERLGDYSEFLWENGRKVESEPLLKRQLAIVSKHPGYSPPLVVVIMRDYANVLHETGRSAEATKMIERAVAFGEKQGVFITESGEVIFDPKKMRG